MTTLATPFSVTVTALLITFLASFKTHHETSNIMTTLKPRKLVIAIDFGTTYSGVAYWLGRNEPESREVQVICEWPAIFPHEGEMPKVPTKVGYQEDGTIKWGNLASGKMQPIQWVKLLLLEDQDLPYYLQQNQSEHLSTARQLIHGLKKNAIDVVSDYCKCNRF